MRKWVERRPSPAMAVAFIALLAALSGTAAALPGKNGVDSGDIKNGQVKGRDIAKNAVTGKKVKNSSLIGPDVKNASLTGLDINESSLGKVPSAAASDNATHASAADNSAALGGDPASKFLRAGRLRSGQTLTGTYALAAHIESGWFIPATQISFPVPLDAAPAVTYVPPAGTNPNCPGTVNDPSAPPGRLCVYGRRQDGGVPFLEQEASGRTGFRLFPNAGTPPVNTQYDGTWAVTAP
jgi:hypothetical protein